MNDLTGKEYTSMVVSNKERKLIELLRDTKYGQVVLYLEDSEPVRIEKIKESVKL